jgi:hypothetical protein
VNLHEVPDFVEIGLHNEHRADDLRHQLRSFFCFGVALSTAESNKWLLLIEDRSEGRTPEVHTATDYQLLGQIRQ